VAEASDVVFTSLPTPSDVDTVCNGLTGLAGGFREGAAWFDLSTSSVELVRALHAQLARHGVDILDAPVSGGPGGAASGKLALWVGGDRTVYDRCERVLKSLGDQARYVGDIGAGSIAKLVHTCASAAAAAVITEAFTLGVKAGVEPLALWEAIRQGAFGRNRSFEMFGTRFLPGKFDPPPSTAQGCAIGPAALPRL
jgi:3-hydroxyisobutyrate dehydrogenase-like beta-hydroxyacid dehydrogenase